MIFSPDRSIVTRLARIISLTLLSLQVSIAALQPDTALAIASRAQTPPSGDGLLTEDLWKGVDPVSQFTQRELEEGMPATERTEVRIVYTDRALYIGVWCYDSVAEEIVANQLQRDFNTEVDDNFKVIIDTYRDKRNGFLFIINPNGARYDALVTDEGLTVNSDWNGLWDVQTKITTQGWFAIIEIPFSTLRFSDEPNQVWGINFERNIRRKREQDLWRGYSRNYTIEKLSQAGILRGVNNVRRGSQVEIKPYLLGGLEKTYPPFTDARSTLTKAGLDIKSALTSTLTLDATFNTDFAQVEADRVRINLTRFPLYYPEKRDFFLEGAGIFDFQFGDSPKPFYSRRIGITANGDLLPILAGIRLVGKTDRYDVGFLTMQSTQSAGEPTTNYTVARMKREILEQSYVGIIATSRQSSLTYNRLLGGDAALIRSDVFGTNTLIAGAALATTAAPGINTNNVAYRAYVDFPNDFINHFIGIRGVQRNFDPQVGFLDRSGFRQYSWTFLIRPRPKGIGMQYVEFKPMELDYFVNPDGTMQSVNYEGRILGFQTNSGEAFEWNVQRFADSPPQDFEIFENEVITHAAYWWTRWELQLQTNTSRNLSCWFLYSWGGFYNGQRQRFSATPVIKFRGHLAFTLDYTRNTVQLPAGSFATDEAATSIEYGFSTRLGASIFTQWNNEDKQLNMNFRLHWIPQIGSDAYLVYNHLFDSAARIRTARTTILAKIAYMFVL